VGENTNGGGPAVVTSTAAVISVIDDWDKPERCEFAGKQCGNPTHMILECQLEEGVLTIPLCIPHLTSFVTGMLEGVVALRSGR
jgi:hypothetical protein